MLMKRSSAIVLQGILVLIGISALAFLLWEPHIEGRNANATLFQIYFNDPFLAYAYIASIPFFVALSQAYTMLRHAGERKKFVREAVKALRIIRYCALIIIGFVAVGEIYILLSTDDRAGGVFMGILITFGAVVIAVAATLLRHRLSKCADRTA
ncbi:MAG: DUF2975 domain-containing protein [Parcubacteria group bacterium]